MSEEKINQELSDNELKDVDGGHNWKVQEGEAFKGRKKQLQKNSINKKKFQSLKEKKAQIGSEHWSEPAAD